MSAALSTLAQLCLLAGLVASSGCHRAALASDVDPGPAQADPLEDALEREPESESEPARSEIEKLLDCHPTLVGELEFGPPGARLADAEAASLIVADATRQWQDWEQQGLGSATVVVIAQYGADETLELGRRRVAVVRTRLLDEGVRADAIRADAFSASSAGASVFIVEPMGCVLPDDTPPS